VVDGEIEEVFAIGKKNRPAMGAVQSSIQSCESLRTARRLEIRPRLNTDLLLRQAFTCCTSAERQFDSDP
jgi:hypothetical protein